MLLVFESSTYFLHANHAVCQAENHALSKIAEKQRRKSKKDLK